MKKLTTKFSVISEKKTPFNNESKETYIVISETTSNINTEQLSRDHLAEVLKNGKILIAEYWKIYNSSTKLKNQSRVFIKSLHIDLDGVYYLTNEAGKIYKTYEPDEAIKAYNEL